MTKQYFQVGDVLYSSWGYEQTNINFYQVVKATDKTVWVREISKQIEEEYNTYSNVVKPNTDDFISEVFRRKIQHYMSNPSIEINSFANASKITKETLLLETSYY